MDLKSIREHVTKIRAEFGVNVKNQEDLNRIESILAKENIRLASSNLNEKTIEIEVTNSRAQKLGDLNALQLLIENKTGFETVIKGLGHLSSAVAELHPTRLGGQDPIRGVVRLSQLEGDRCFVDGSLSGFQKHNNKDHLVAIHEYGDLSDPGYLSIGSPIVRLDRTKLGYSSSNRIVIQIRKVLPECRVSEMIGRSIALSDNPEQVGRPMRILSAGIIARASTIDGNKKTICSCSGRTIWEERVEKKQDKSQ